jgi:glycosyltransferase involved in cell wall biosynthesis
LKRVLILSPYEDTAGIGITLRRSFDRWAPEWEARHVRRANNYLDYPVDIEWPGDTQNPEVEELVQQADVIHVMEQPDILAELGPLDGKRIVVQHLGTYYRDNPDVVSEQCQVAGAIEVASGFDLMLKPHLLFVPLPAELPGVAELRSEYRVSDKVRIAHAPTNREVKSTDLIIEAVERLKQRHAVHLDLIEGEPWGVCLARKARADIYVDELRLGYGLNALECWAMGIPVVSGIVGEPRTKMLAEFGSLPFLEAAEATLERKIESLVTSQSLRSRWGRRGQKHLRSVHSPQAVVHRMVEIYAS